MFGVTTSDDYRPVTWMGRFPVDVTTILVALHVVVAILTCLVVAAGGGAVLNFMLFDSARVLGAGQIWRLATYAFVHSPSMLLWFAIEMYMLFVFGREVERFIGQRAYIALYALLLFIPSLLLTVWGLGQRTGLAGSLALHFGIFVAFATIYPSAELLLRITAKWTRSYSGRDLRPAIAGLQCLDRSSGPLNKHRGWLLLCPLSWSRAGVGLVGESQGPATTEAEV